MKEKSNKSKEAPTADTPNCVAIMGILAEMARCLNENISKVHLAPLDPSLTAQGSADQVQMLMGIVKH